MNCDREGATYHLACDCREAASRADTLGYSGIAGSLRAALAEVGE